MMLIFSIVIFLSAFLLFQVQPLISRYILPWFGGAAAVWSAAMLVFQILLLAGYGYSHWLAARDRKLPRHLVLLAASLLVVFGCALAWGTPLLPGSSWKPLTPDLPLLRVVAILLAGVGLPYFVLSTTSPLLQAWFERLYPGKTPYRLYALSNTGSLLALVSYPVVFEPLLSLRTQARLWALAYLICAVLLGFLAVRVLGSRDRKTEASGAAGPETRPAGDSPAGSPAPARRHRFLWVALSACTSILLLSITNQLSQEVAVIPFLWVLPLSIYLFSFVVTFSGERGYFQPASLAGLGITTVLLGYIYSRIESVDALSQVAVLSFFLLSATLVLHAELYRLRPAPGRLTSFYFLISLGGALGGIFVNLAAPLLFNGYWEFQLGVLLCWLLVIYILIREHGLSFKHRWARFSPALLLLIVGWIGVVFFTERQETLQGVLEMHRSFYGVFRVRRIAVGDPAHEAISLTHGLTSHGFQFQEAGRRSLPTSYYGRRSGIGLAISASRAAKTGRISGQAGKPGHGLRVGVVGLGTGTLAAYGEPGDTFRFYEINPDIIALALGERGYFTFLKDSPAETQVVPGDARLALEQELAAGQAQDFDILAVDAFSGDSIPVHLLTLEAFDIYLQHLDPQGVLAIHTSNRYLNLAPVVQTAAARYRLDYAQIPGPGDGQGSYASTWILLSRNSSFFKIPEIEKNSAAIPGGSRPVRAWTDDYSNLFQSVRFYSFIDLAALEDLLGIRRAPDSGIEPVEAR